MKRIKITLLISLLFFGLFFICSGKANAEIIRNFSTTINVLPDSSILVNDNIVYDFETAIRHGIFRTIPLKNSKNEDIEVNVVSVLDSNSNAYKFTEEVSNGVLNIKIGDPERMISGVKVYNITYQVFGSIGYFDDFDEIYWNTTGSEWKVAIEKSEVRVVLPNNVFPTQQDCYYGKSGSRTKCKIVDTNIFTSPSTLNEGEGLTVAVGFPKGVVSVYQPKVESFYLRFIKTYWPISVPLIVFAFMLMRWYKKGRDPKGTGVIVAQYDAPNDLTPLEVGGIINNKIKNQNISAEIIYLAVKGYIKIKKLDDKILGIISKKDYEFTLIKEEGILANDFDKKILNALFSDKGDIGSKNTLSDLKNDFYKAIPPIDNMVADSLLSKKYFKNFPKFRGKDYAIILTSLFAVFFLLTKIIGVQNNLNNPLAMFILAVSIITSVIIALVFTSLMPARSPKGVSMYEYLLGLKLYLQIAEKDRLKFHNAPEKRPEIFESLLPFAMIFGVEELWAREFKDIYVNPPSWYDGGAHSFNAVSFGAEMAIFNSLATSSLSSSPSSSGSGGGGFSGGGGGGGGGGSW